MPDVRPRRIGVRCPASFVGCRDQGTNGLYSESQYQAATMTRLTIGLILGIAVVQAGRGQQAPPGGEQKQPGAPEARRRFAVGSVKLGKLIVAPKAEIPRLAVLARIRGWVRMEAEIDKSGHVASLHVLSGHPFLIPAAMEAAKQYQYEPTMIRDTPVIVLETIEIEFQNSEPSGRPMPSW